MADYEDYQGELEVIDEEEQRSVTPADTITPVIIILTTIFTLIGISLIAWELFNVYDAWGDPGKQDAILSNIKIGK